jgi:hypothetical protein
MMSVRARRGLTSAFLLLGVLACHPSTAPGGSAALGAFPADAAMATLQELLGSPRAPGAVGRAAAIEDLAARLRRAGAVVTRREHTAVDPISGARLELTTLVGHVRPRARRRFVLATHFDTPPRAHEDPDPAARERAPAGANDGTSGVAVLLHLLPRLAAGLPRSVGFDVVLFDGEEVGAPGRGGYCMGSRALAERLRAGTEPVLARAQFGIVLDMVGDRELRIPVDPRSREMNPALVAHLWAAGAAVAPGVFVAAEGPGVLDDHVFLGAGGIPSVLLIDYEFPAWHTLADDGSAVASQSLAAVGDTLERALLGGGGQAPYFTEQP